jgi:hypothetical protein
MQKVEEIWEQLRCVGLGVILLQSMEMEIGAIAAAAHTVGDIASRGVNGRWVRREIEVKVRCLTERHKEEFLSNVVV